MSSNSLCALSFGSSVHNSGCEPSTAGRRDRTVVHICHLLIVDVSVQDFWKHESTLSGILNKVNCGLY